MALEIHITNIFKKDICKLEKQGKDLSLLYGVIETISNEEMFAVKYRDHALIGNWAGRRECHI